MNSFISRPRPQGAFTMMELLVAFTVFVLMLGFILSLSDGVRRGWERGEHQVDVCQNGRAILNLFERDLSPAVVSSIMQFGQEPDLSSLLPANEAQVVNSTSIFWWAPSSTSPSGLRQTGWYLTRDPNASSPSEQFRLCRFNRTPTQDDIELIVAGGAEKLGWFSNLDQSIFVTKSSVISNGTIGYWAQCLDRNGEPPEKELSDYDPTAAPLRFNSSARFQMSPRGIQFEDGKTFHYTASTTKLAYSLPDSVRVVFLLTDERTLTRHSDITQIPSSTVPMDLDEIAVYADQLSQKGIQTRVFTTTIKLVNSLDR